MKSINYRIGIIQPERFSIIILIVMNMLFFVCYPVITSHAQQLARSAAVINSPANPFGGAYESPPPPRIIVIYNNTEYLGVLDSYSFRVADTLGEIPIFNDTVISTIPNQTIAVENGSILRFAIKGNAPPEAQSDGLACPRTVLLAEYSS